MENINIKNEKITPFRGIFQVRELFSRYVDFVIDSVLGISCCTSEKVNDTHGAGCYSERARRKPPQQLSP